MRNHSVLAAEQHPVTSQDATSPATEAVCEFLLSNSRLKQADLKRAETYRDQNGGDLVTLLVRLGLVSERDVAEAESDLLQLPLIRTADLPEEVPELPGISVRYLKENQILPIAETDEDLTVVMANPRDEFAVHSLAMASGKHIVRQVGIASEVENGIEKLLGGGRSAMGQIVDRLGAESEGELEDVEHLRDLASEAPVIRLVNLVMQRAVEARASDIHIEPFENRLKVRYRIDGVLQEVEAPPASSTAAVISRIKIMAKLNIAERRLPQDGRIMHRVQGKELDLRVSTVPTSHGESVVMRILDRESIVLDFASLGFDDHIKTKFIHALEMPHGIILVTGPTGSGKTTTLYTALSSLNTSERKIITVEDPVEYQLEGINQIQAKSSIGLDFSHALRAIVRQDPDVIMIGEMRDLETAKIAIQSALTGHLVLSTVHTNDAAGGVTRMLDMGVEDYLLTSTVNAILAQRLVRTLDTEHREAYRATAGSGPGNRHEPTGGTGSLHRLPADGHRTQPHGLPRPDHHSGTVVDDRPDTQADHETRHVRRNPGPGGCRGYAYHVSGRLDQMPAGHYHAGRSTAGHAGKLRSP